MRPRAFSNQSGMQQEIVRILPGTWMVGWVGYSAGGGKESQMTLCTRA